MTNACIKDNANQQQLSQQPYEDQLSDKIWPRAHTPVSKSDTPLSTASTQYSSGYYSDSSCSDSVGGLKSTQPSYKQRRGRHGNFTTVSNSLIKPPVTYLPIHRTSHTISMDNNKSSHSSAKGLKNDPTRRELSASPDCYKNTSRSRSSSQKHSTLYSESSSTRKTMIPKLSRCSSPLPTSRPTSSYYTSCSCHSPPATLRPPTVPEPKSILQCW